MLRATVLLYVQTRVDTRMMLCFFKHLLSLPLRFFQQRSSGDLLARLNSHVVIRDTISNQLLSTILEGSFVVTYRLLLFVRSVAFGWLALGLGLLQVSILLASHRVIRAQAIKELLAQGKAQGYAAVLSSCCRAGDFRPPRERDPTRFTLLAGRLTPSAQSSPLATAWVIAWVVAWIACVLCVHHQAYFSQTW